MPRGPEARKPRNLSTICQPSFLSFFSTLKATALRSSVQNNVTRPTHPLDLKRFRIVRVMGCRFSNHAAARAVVRPHQSAIFQSGLHVSSAPYLCPVAYLIPSRALPLKFFCPLTLAILLGPVMRSPWVVQAVLAIPGFLSFLVSHAIHLHRTPRLSDSCRKSLAPAVTLLRPASALFTQNVLSATPALALSILGHW